MKKMTKLLAVLLAMLMMFSSMSIMSSAAKVEYKTAANLETLAAYSPDGEVTRLSTEERLSIVIDFLDGILLTAIDQSDPKPLFDVLGLSLTLDLRSFNHILGTIDNVKSLRSNTLVSMISGLLGILADLEVDTWQSGMTREGTAHETILLEITELLAANTGLAGEVLSSGELDLGVASSAVKGLDLSIIGDIPGLIKGMIVPLFQRWDDPMTLITSLEDAKTGDGKMVATLNAFVQRLFTNDMSITTYKEYADGTVASDHALPGPGSNLRCYYVRSGDTLTVYSYDVEKGAYVTDETSVYTRGVEKDGLGNDTEFYTFTRKNIDGTEEGFKYYDLDSPLLPELAADLEAGNVSIDLTAQSAVDLLHLFIPYVFDAMVPVVVNGSLKKLLGDLFGAEYTYVGLVGSDEVAALPDAANTFFTQEQGEYLWEWSDYAVINGNHYYRFEDQIFAADISNINPFFNNIDWNWKFEKGYFNKYLPANSGYQTILQSLNNFLVDVALEVFDDTFEATIGLTKGDNSNLIENLKKGAQKFIAVSPESLFGSNYADPDRYYSLIMSDDNQEVLIGIACTVIDLVMPQALLPTADTIKGTGLKLGAIAAFVLRELATQLVPQYNYDALIYSNYNKKTFVSGKDNAYWLDVVLTIGTDIGLYYLSALADMGEDNAAWAGAYYYTEKTYAEADLTATGTIKLWEARVDYIVDWALTTGEYSWNFEKLVNCSNVDMATAQDPWAKIGEVFMTFIPVGGIFNVDTSDAQWLKTLLRDNFVLAIFDLDITKIVGGASATGIINIPTTSKLYSANVLSQVVIVIKNLLNGLLYKVAGNANLIQDAITTLDTLLNQANIASLVQNLLTLLHKANGNGLLKPILPIVGFFLGWQTNPQKFADPAMTLKDTANGGAYLLSASGAIDGTFTVRNASSGMLYKHNPEGTYDSPYVITIKSITATAGLTAKAADGTSAFAATEIQPGASADFRLTGTYSADTAFTVTVKYTVTGKDGTAIGGEQVAVMYGYMDDSTQENEQVAAHTEGYQVKNTAISKVDAVRVQREAFDRVIYAPSLQAGVAARVLTYSNTSGESYAQWVYSATGANNPAFVTVSQDYVHGCNEVENLKSNKIGWMDGDNKTNILTPLKYNAEFDATDYVSGTVSASMGNVNVIWHNHKKDGTFGVKDGGDVKVTIQSGDLGQIYVVNTDGLKGTVDSYQAKNLVREDFNASADAAWTNYVNAMYAAVRTCYLPYMMNTTTFASEFGVDTLEARAEDLDAAYAALQDYVLADGASAASEVEILETALETVETGEADINFQDYDLYEYFNYQDYRTGTRNMINAYYGPIEPVKALAYMDGSRLDAEANAEALASASGQRADALVEAQTDPTDAEMAAYEAAMAAYVEPSNTLLALEDQAAKTVYYSTFLKARGTNAKAFAFLTQEIAYAAAQNYVQADYSEDSWAAYADALANAQAMQATDLQSEIFAAKFELMKAQKNLLLASKSVFDLGLDADLKALEAQANVLLDNPQYYAPKAEFEGEAWGALITALGYEYTDADGNNVILFNDSAREYLTYDRENTAANLRRIDACEAALQEAIDMFECTIKVVEKDGDDTTTVTQAVRIINGIEPGSITTMEELLSHVKASSADATLAPTVSKANAFGTGAKVDVNVASIGTLTTYYVVIYGDVNGDGAVDAFDAIEVDANKAAIDGAYATAADTNGDGNIDATDYSAIASASATTAVIAQVK